LLPDWLLRLEHPADIQGAIDACLTVEPRVAMDFALGYAEQEMGMEPPLHAALVLPVEDSRGVKIAYQVVVTDLGDMEGYHALGQYVDSVLKGEGRRDGSEFQKVHEESSRHFFTIRVAAYLFRHPVNLAHRGLPRYLAEKDELTEECPGAVQPLAVLPAAGIPGVREIVRYGCEDGTTLLYSHHANVRLDPKAVRTRHLPHRAFQRWARNTRTKYRDRVSRLAFLGSLWRRYMREGL
jgi:hypothetical protein